MNFEMRRMKTLPLATVIALAALAGCDRGATVADTASGAPATPGARPGGNSGATPTTPALGGTSATTGTSSAAGQGATPGAAGSPGTNSAGSSAATDSKVAQANTGGATASGGATAASVSAGDRKFMLEAAGDGMYEVAVGKLAAEKARNPAVKKFGQTIVSDHSKANHELRQLASAKGVSLPTEIPAGKKATLDRLSKASGAEFDKQFVQSVGLEDHMADIKKFETAARDSADPQVKAFAKKILPTLRQHHGTAEKLAKASVPNSSR